jgi:hypothetical protein
MNELEKGERARVLETVEPVLVQSSTNNKQQEVVVEQ